jgi:hypothetical protein
LQPNLHWFRKNWYVFVIIALAASGTTYWAYNNWGNSLIVCPGCNSPEMLSLDHYTIQNNTSQKPSLLTIWFAGNGPAGKSLTPLALYIANGPTKYPDCHWITYNESSCLAPYNVTGVTIPVQSVVPVPVDTSSSGFYFVAGQHYTIDVQADKYDYSGFQVAYPPESLVQTEYMIGYDTGQANATVLNIWLANRGTASATLSAVTLQDSMSNSSPITFPMSGPTISKPGGWVEVTVDTLSSGFYFTHQHFYSLSIKASTGPPSISTISFS